jgi:hypothetical protein
MADNLTPIEPAAAVAAAIVADVSGRMPTLAEMNARDASNTDPTDMGPDVSLPAVHMHILIQHMQFLGALATEATLEMKIARATAIGLAPDDVGDARALYAGRIGDVLVKAFAGDHDEAVSTLMHSAAAILATKYEARFAARALETGAAMFASDIRRQYERVGPLQ